MSARRYLVAAATSGLGFAVAENLVHAGHDVAICGRDELRLADALQRLSGHPGTVHGTKCDLTHGDGPQTWVAGSVDKLGGTLDGVFVNTGGPGPAPFAKTTDEDWLSGFQQIVMPAVRLVRAAHPHLAAGSAVVFSTSSVVREPSLTPELVVSAALRSAVATLAKSLSREWAPEIRVNHLIPGRIATERVRSLDAKRAAATGVAVEEVVQQSQAKIPLGRYGDAKEYAAAASWLLSPGASYVTGATLTADGGLVAGV
ncbi:SDR family oxidoreductase [Mycolicibacterium litorale]|uniref:SDR family oxidoreductase n=1 Tax=Mycolicibacterium litorale TaxID=758802 RepID=UPI003CEBF95A